jgi:hypothetical protein
MIEGNTFFFTRHALSGFFYFKIDSDIAFEDSVRLPESYDKAVLKEQYLVKV